MGADEVKDPQEEAGPADPTPQAATPAEPHGTDWKAEARKWEERAKANKDAAARLDEAERAAKEAREELAHVRAAKERADLLAKVSQETGVPSALLHGDDEAELTACAAAINGFVSQRSPGYPGDKGGSQPGGPKLTRKSIEEVRDPVERVRLIARNRELFD